MAVTHAHQQQQHGLCGSCGRCFYLLLLLAFVVRAVHAACTRERNPTVAPTTSGSGGIRFTMSLRPRPMAIFTADAGAGLVHRACEVH
eukprot:CAMPEP_0115828450 /NCGR_PEP_ID=MMETSP0287-20121206/579_1 /TAXON_ID=412157 /ORGANISM="Chrysochromulina rotalis, Strain UIO044" /LENGTH=87 /DNA_ID=CAMNT_0003281665 /DNA_START=318 /DNA_END=581 /DNA_ORIENTATION=+